MSFIFCHSHITFSPSFLVPMLLRTNKTGRKKKIAFWITFFVFFGRHDKFAAGRRMLELFNAELARHLQCGVWLAHDETLYPFR